MSYRVKFLAILRENPTGFKTMLWYMFLQLDSHSFECSCHWGRCLFKRSFLLHSVEGLNTISLLPVIKFLHPNATLESSIHLSNRKEIILEKTRYNTYMKDTDKDLQCFHAVTQHRPKCFTFGPLKDRKNSFSTVGAFLLKEETSFKTLFLYKCMHLHVYKSKERILSSSFIKMNFLPSLVIQSQHKVKGLNQQYPAWYSFLFLFEERGVYEPLSHVNY